MRPYIGIGTIIKDHVGNTGRVIGYDDENKIVTIRYADRKTTSVRTVSELTQDIRVLSYKEVD